MQVEFHPLFKEDLAQAVFYYESKQSGLGDHFLNDYLETIREVIRNATIYRKFDDENRKRNFSRFKAFTIIYEVRRERIYIKNPHLTEGSGISLAEHLSSPSRRPGLAEERSPHLQLRIT